MAQLKELLATERSQFAIFAVLSLGVAVLTTLLYLLDNHAFDRYFGNLNPLIVIPIIIVLGGALLLFLLSRGWFAIYKTNTLQGILVSAGLAIPLALIVIQVDRIVVFPKDMNVAFPRSLLFYPAIGYVVEVIFHLLPLTLLMIAATSLFKKADPAQMVWGCMFIVSLLEPVFQITGFAGRYPSRIVVYVGLHVFIINFLQLWIFERYGFVSMFSFRLAYYLLWHIVWGYARLNLLF